MAAADETKLDALMAQLAQGDRSAFAPLFPELQERALRVAQARLDHASAADVVQASLLKVFARADEFTPGRSVLAWFYGIVANEVRKSLRAKRKQTTLDDEQIAEIASIEDIFITRELERALEAAIAELEPEAAESIHALLGRGPKPNLASATFRKRVSRAYARLRILMGELP